MKTDHEIRSEGLEALTSKLGPVQAERFISLILREPFDYTAWRKNLWPNESVESISKAAMEFQKQSK